MGAYFYFGKRRLKCIETRKSRNIMSVRDFLKQLELTQRKIPAPKRSLGSLNIKDIFNAL